MEACVVEAGNANEFLHGAFEVVQPDTPVLLFKGEDETRFAVIDRVEAFLNKNTGRCSVINSKDYTFPASRHRCAA